MAFHASALYVRRHKGQTYISYSGALVMTRQSTERTLGLRIVLAVCACLLWGQAQAAAPVIATMDRSVWPERLETPALFDVA